MLPVIFFSCGKLATKFIVSVHNNSFLYSKITNADREVIYLPMIHLNKREYYQMIKHKVDSLRNAGYKVFYESVAVSPALDKTARETVYRKFRNRVGFVPMDYFSDKNSQHPQLKVRNYIMQDFENTGIKPDKDRRADLPMDSLVMLYEKRFGEILLTDCDRKTEIGHKYKCRPADREDYNFIVRKIRDEHLLHAILSSKLPKIVVLFGQEHEKALKANLQLADHSWKWSYHYQKIP